jgi:hypothetical protein
MCNLKNAKSFSSLKRNGNIRNQLPSISLPMVDGQEPGFVIKLLAVVFSDTCPTTDQEGNLTQ